MNDNEKLTQQQKHQISDDIKKALESRLHGEIISLRTALATAERERDDARSAASLSQTHVDVLQNDYITLRQALRGTELELSQSKSREITESTEVNALTIKLHQVELANESYANNFTELRDKLRESEAEGVVYVNALKIINMLYPLINPHNEKCECAGCIARKALAKRKDL